MPPRNDDKALKLASIIIGVALVAAILALTFLLPASWNKELNKTGLYVMSPVFALGDKCAQFIHKYEQGWSTLGELENENSELRAEVARLTTDNTVLKDETEENNRLKELLGFKRATQYRLLSARLVARDPGNWWSNILVNRGYSDDASLRSDLPVINARGVIGKTGTVSQDVTEVILMNNQNCKISAIIENSKEQGIEVGDGNLDNGKSRCRLTYVARTAQVAVGERVFTSGLGGVFPPGLLLGSISEVPPLSPKLNFGLYREVYVEPVVDLSSLNEMFIVLEAPAADSRGKDGK